MIGTWFAIRHWWGFSRGGGNQNVYRYDRDWGFIMETSGKLKMGLAPPTAAGRRVDYWIHAHVRLVVRAAQDWALAV